MKVKIGKYKSWFGPYQLANLLFGKILGKDKSHDIGEKLADTWIGGFLSWVDGLKKRTIKVKIDDHDVWNADHTLALVILPVLKKIKEDKTGSSFVDDDDVPDSLKSTAVPAPKNEWDTDDNFFKRWDYVIDEMIFAFENIVDDSWEEKFHSGEIDMVFEVTDETKNLPEKEQFFKMTKGPKDTHVFDKIGHDEYNDRISNGCRLFGKYYRSLWT